jgi:hypothetical protein
MFQRNRGHLIHILILCCIQLLTGLLFIGSVPRIYIDEAWDASIGYELMETGFMRHPFIKNFGGMDVHFVQPRVILPIVCAGVFKIAGYSVAASRLPSLFMGILAIIALYYIANNLIGSRQSFFVCLATIIYPWFWVNCRRCRPEMYYTAIALLFLCVVISFIRREHAMKALLAGILAGLAALTHPNGIIILFAIIASWLMWERKRNLIKFIIYSFIGFVITILPYLLYLHSSLKDSGVSLSEQLNLSPIYSSVLSMEMVRWKSFFQFPLGVPIAILIFVSWCAAWWKSSTKDKFLASVVAIYVLALPIVSQNCIPDYCVVIIPFMVMLIFRLLSRLEEFNFLVNSKKLLIASKVAVVFVYVVTSVPAIFLMLYVQRGADFNCVVNEVSKVVDSKGKVFGDPVFWVGHDKYVYGAYYVGNEYVTAKDVMQWAYQQSFDYVVRTSWDAGRPPQGFRKVPNKIRQLGNNTFGDILCKKVGSKIYEFYNDQYGPIEIYKLDWSNAWKWGLQKKQSNSKLNTNN